MAKAHELGIQFEDLREAWGIDAVKYVKGQQKALVFDGRGYPSLSAEADLICNNKHITKAFFNVCNIPCPQSQVFQIVIGQPLESTDLASLIGDNFVAGQSYVCKPLFGTDGHAVGMNLKSLDEIRLHLNDYLEAYEVWLLEEQVKGEDLRIQVIGGKIAAACVRIPARVIGNGQDSLSELIERHNEKIQQQNPYNKLEIDAATKELMEAQHVKLDSVIKKGLEIQLKYVSNMGQGGLAIDITDELHPLYHDWAAALSQAIGIRTFAFDLMSEGPSWDPNVYANAIELNPRAQWLHHTFSERKQHDIPKLILEDLFSSLSES